MRWVRKSFAEVECFTHRGTVLRWLLLRNCKWQREKGIKLHSCEELCGDSYEWIHYSNFIV